MGDRGTRRGRGAAPTRLAGDRLRHLLSRSTLRGGRRIRKHAGVLIAVADDRPAESGDRRTQQAFRSGRSGRGPGAFQEVEAGGRGARLLSQAVSQTKTTEDAGEIHSKIKT